MGQANRCATKIQPKAVGGGIFGRILKSGNCRLEVSDNVISGAAVGWVGVDVRVKFDDSTLNSAELFDSLAGRTRFAHFCAVFNCIVQPIRRS